MPKIKIVVMSLPNSRRKPKIKKQLEDSNFKFEFSDGISKNNLNIDFENSTVSDSKYTIRFNMKPDPIFRGDIVYESFGYRKLIKIGEIGTFFAHYNVWKKLISDSSADAYLILEDDVSLLFSILDFERFCDVANLEDIDMIQCQKISPCFLKGKVGFENLPEYITPIGRERDIWQNTEGGAAYIMTKRGAERIIKFVEEVGFFNTIDNKLTRAFIYQQMNIFYCPNYLQASLNDEAEYSEVHHVDIAGELKVLGKIDSVIFMG